MDGWVGGWLGGWVDVFKKKSVAAENDSIIKVQAFCSNPVIYATRAQKLKETTF